MFNLSEKLSSLVSGATKNLKKEKNAQISTFTPTIASGFKEQKGLAGVNKEPETKPESNLVLTDKPQNRTVSRVADNVSKPMMKNPGVKIAYKRNTGVADVDGSPYTNAEDVSLLAKLGYSVDKNLYLFLPRGEDREDLYSYVEKVAGVSKDVARCIDQGTSFSGEHLKDMDYEVPEGYEIKGDLVCPVEKKADSVHTYKLLGEVQGVGLRKELHTLLDEMNHPGLAVNYPETGEVMALIPGNKKNVKTIFNTLKERLSNREEEKLVYGKDYKIKSIPNNNEKFKKFEFTDKHLRNFIDNNPELTRLKAADKDRQFKYFQDRYRLTQNPKGNLAGKLPQKAIDQLKGVAPIYDYQIKQRAENKVKTAAADPAQTILITGHSGSGKSTLGKLLAEKLNLPLHRVDAQQSWDDLRANLEAAPDYERKALTPGTLENKKYIRDIRKIVRKSLGEIDGPAILEGTQVTTLPDKQLKKYMANILVGGDVNQSIAQRLERMSDKAAKKGINFSPEQIEKKKLESKLVAESWSPGMDKFNKLPGVLKYNHTEHKPEALIDQLKTLMNKKASALVVSGIHGDEPAGDKAAQKLKDSADVVSDINPSDKRRFEGKDINRHFDKPTEGKVQKTILDIIRKKKPSKVIALHEDDEVDKPYAYSSESLKDETREALKEYRTASSAHGDKTEDGVISKGKNPPDGSLEKALDDRDIPRVTLETPSKSQNMNKRVETQLDVVKKLLGKKADLTNTQPAMSGNSNVLQTTHSPINIQTSTQGQSTPVDNTAKDKALFAAGKSFLVDQAIGTIPNVFSGISKFTRGLGGLTNKAMLGANKLETLGHIGAGELSARNADNPRTAMADRAMSYASSLLPLVTKNPIAGTASYLVNTAYDAANAADVYHKTMPSAPPSMGNVPEQKFNVPLGQPASNNIDFRLTQPNLRDQYPSSGVRLAKQGENQLEKTASPFSRRLMSILNKSDQPAKNKIIQQLVDYSKKDGKKPKKEFLDRLLNYVNKHHNEWPDGWEMTPEDAAERFSPLTGLYRQYFDRPTNSNFDAKRRGRKQTDQEKRTNSLLSEIFGDVPKDEYSLAPVSSRATGRALRFEEVANNLPKPVTLSEHELDMMGRRKHTPHYGLLERVKSRHSERAGDRVKELMRQGKGVKGLLAQYKIDEQPFQDLLFTPHLANRNNLAREEVMDEYARMKDWIDPDRPGFSDEWLESKLYPGKNKEWAKNPLYETVVDANNINPRKGPIGVSQYYVPAKSEEAGAILAKNLPNADSGFMYKGGPPSALQAAKKLENYTRNDERMFFSGVPEISAGYMSKGNPEYSGHVRPAGFADIRKQIADSVRQYKATVTTPVENYYMNNTADFVGAGVPAPAKGKGKQIKKKAEYKLHWSKDLHRDVTNNRHYPFSFLTGEAQELADAVKNRDWSNFKEEIGDTTYAAQMLAAQATGLNHPVYADLGKHYAREKVWKDMFKEKSSTYHPKHMEGGSNYAKASKIIKAFASAGIKVDQREAERLANKYTGGKMEKEAALSRPGMVTNFPARAIPSPSVGDRIGSLLMGKNYIPSPIDGESMYDAMLRSGRNADMLEVSKNTFGNNPLFHRLGLNKGRLAPLLGVADYMTQGKLSSILSPINGGNTYQANKNIQEMLSNPSIMSQFKQASSNQPLLPGMKQWVKKQPFNHAEDAYNSGRIPKHVRDDIVSGRAAEQYRPKFKEMLESIERSRRKN